MTSCNRAVLLTQFCWLCRTFGGVVPLAEQDAVAESEFRSFVHLPLDHLRLGAGSLGPAVVGRAG
jgi:hypothetical protein